jgi:hypothetical protein
MLVATLLLQSNFVSTSLDNLLTNCIQIWKYLKARGTSSIITLEPSKFAVTMIVKKLGFKIEESKDIIEGKKQK